MSFVRAVQERESISCEAAAAVPTKAGATPWVSLAPDHALQAAHQEDHVSRRAPVDMREMDAWGYCALVVFALHCVIGACSAVNLEGSGSVLLLFGGSELMGFWCS